MPACRAAASRKSCNGMFGVMNRPGYTLPLGYAGRNATAGADAPGAHPVDTGLQVAVCTEGFAAASRTSVIWSREVISVTRSCTCAGMPLLWLISRLPGRFSTYPRARGAGSRSA